jgi:PAS domain S-box-containing protein
LIIDVMSEWSSDHVRDKGPARDADRKWHRYDATFHVRPMDDPQIAAERLGMLDAIIDASGRSDSMAELMRTVTEAICSRYPGVTGGVARLDDSGTTVEMALPESGVDWADLFAGFPQWIADGIDGVSPVHLRNGDTVALVMVFRQQAGVHRAIAFAVPGDVARIPVDVLAVIAVECTYVFDREVMTHRLAQREAELRAVFDASSIPQALMAEDNREFAIVNDAFCRLVGYSRDQMIGMSARTVTHPDDIAGIEAARDAAAADPRGQHRVDRRLIAADGEIIDTHTTLTWIHMPGGARMLLQQITDITAQRRAERDLMEQAETDSLTGIGNRLHLVRTIDDLERAGEDFGVVFLDVDSFKSINDARGHDIGDDILIEVAGRLTAAARPGDIVVRFGGDEFVVLCRDAGAGGTGPPDPAGRGETTARSPLSSAVRQVADTAQRILSEPIETADGSATITVSIGICDDTVPVVRALDRLQYADTAAYQAKRLGEDRKVVYDSGLHRQTTEYRRIEALLRTALEENRFVVHYQPIVGVTDGRPVGLEALARLRDDGGHLVPPMQFIDVAERSGLIVPMGVWVLGEACRTTAALRRMVGFPVHVSVNIAARQAARPDLPAVVDHALADAGLPPDSLTLELTESALLEADDSTLVRLHDMSAQGIEIALDDFGTGYSSLTYLRQLPVTRIKVDQTFVSAMTTDPGSAAIVRAVTSLARDLGLTWVAEGVETADQWSALRKLGGGLAQGFYFARPQPIDMLKHTLTRTFGIRMR